MSQHKTNLIDYELVNDLLIFKWEDGFEGYIPLKMLREKCPCANCEGEKAVSYTHLTLPTTERV